MKRLIALLALSGAVAVAACDDPRSAEDDAMTEIPAEDVMAPSAEDVAVPTDATVTPPPAAPTDSTTLPAEKKSSEESVQPESETLFY